MATFEEMCPRFVATAAQLARIKGDSLESTVLDRASASLLETGYDSWGNGTTFYTLALAVPIPTYASVEDRRSTLEKGILRRLQEITRADVDNRITEVVISPILAEEARPEVDSDTAAADEPLPTFWQPGFFRLFVSHVAATKASAHRLKQALAVYRVAAFVAHDDIEPTREWQSEIERALRTMDALVALVSPGFLESRWCDQEVGIAIGRGKLVLPIRAGADPHGFAGKYQAIAAQGLDATQLAQRIVDIVAAHPQSAARMTDTLVEKLATSTSWDASKQTLALLEKGTALTEAQSARLLRAIEENIDVRDAWGVPEKIRALVEGAGRGQSN